MLLNKKVILIIPHLAGWALFLYVTQAPKGPMSGLFIASYLFLVAYFYVNSYVFVPHFLSKKHISLFIGITLAVYAVFCMIMPWIFRTFFTLEPPFRPEMMMHGPPEMMMPDGRRTGVMELIRRFGFYSRSSQFLVVFIISAGLKAVSQWYAEKQRLQELENSMVQAELSFLKSQIHPHFLFNSLNSIYYLALSKDDKAPEAILSLSDFLRFVTTESDNSRIPLEKEVRMLEEYIHLQSLRASEKFDLRFTMAGDFNGLTIMPLTFIPFVENAFKYGISAHIDCFIHIALEVEDGRLKFDCDNSIVAGLKDISRSSGIGLSNIRKRLELAYPGHHEIVIDDDRLAFHVKLQIDLNGIS